MKVTVSLEFPSEEIAAEYFYRRWYTNTSKNAAAVSPAPAGEPAQTATVQPIAPQPAPAPLPTPSPMPPPAPANNGGGNVTIQQVMGSMQEYAKIHKAAGIKNVLSHVGISKITEANPEQLLWLKGVFDLNQPMAAAV